VKQLILIRAVLFYQYFFSHLILFSIVSVLHFHISVLEQLLLVNFSACFKNANLLSCFASFVLFGWIFFFGEHGCFLTTKIVELLVVVMDGFIGLISNQSHIR